MRPRAFLVCSAMAHCGTLNAQFGGGYLITTVAGNGIRGFGGDGGLATAAQLYNPSGVASDAAGNLFVADTFNSRIRKVSSNGIITTIAGNGTAGFSGDGGLSTAAPLNYPGGVAVDSAGNLYIVDGNNSRIRKVSVSGIITTIAGTESPGFGGDGGLAAAAQLNYPSGVAVDALGNLFIADTSNGRIRKVSANGIITTIAGTGIGWGSGDGGLATVARLNTPRGVAVDFLVTCSSLTEAISGFGRCRQAGLSPPSPATALWGPAATAIWRRLPS